MNFEQAGWFIPGRLNSGWANYYQSNFNDLRVKLTQLGLRSLIPGAGPDGDLGFYFSQGNFDFIQLLRTADNSEEEHSNVGSAQVTRRIVAYSLWFSTQGWGAFSPVPLLEPLLDGGRATTTSSDVMEDEHAWNPAGWYLIAQFHETWFRGLADNLKRVAEKQKELGLRELSPFYFTGTWEYQGLQLLQAQIGQATALMQYISWFGENEFGSLRPTPFMSTALVSAALILADRNP